VSKRRPTGIAVVSLVAIVGCTEPTRPVIDDSLPSESQLFAGPDRYIVVFTDAVADPPGVARGMAAEHGLELRHTYSTALKGFAAVVPPARMAALRADPRVRYVTPDRVHQIHQQGGLLPTGIDRIEAELHPSHLEGAPPVDVDIAILDSGIDTDHPDLSPVHRVISFAGGSGEDGNGHGTHVAGIAAANGAGLVGVAPGARIWAVKVCKNGGSCILSDILAGINYVADHADEIDVVNMSLGGRGSDDGACGTLNEDLEHVAICAATELGVVFVVSAGNGGAAAGNVPAAYSEVITVSALADFDGKRGGEGAPTCRPDEDDSFANFSSYGAAVDVMAPGVCIESAWKQGGYNIISGTSMAAPHVAGTAALYIAEHGGAVDGAGVADIKSALLGSAIGQGDHCGLKTVDDDDGFPEPIIFANALILGGTGTCGESAEPVGTDLAITGVSAPAIAGPGQVIEVRVTLKNTGASDVTEDIPVYLVSNNTTPETGNDILIGTQTLPELAAGTSEELVFSWDTSALPTPSLGDHTITASHGFTDDDADDAENNNSLTAIVTLAVTMHVGDLEGSSDPPEKGAWTARVWITAHDADENPLNGATVFGTWTSPDGTGSCVTVDGRCEVSYSGISRGKEIQIWFTVDSLVLDGVSYDPTANHDPDGDSDGTTIEVLAENEDD
jgi:subtilisin